jgi:hypothetical protein
MLTSKVKVCDFLVVLRTTFVLVPDDGLLSQNMKHMHFRPFATGVLHLNFSTFCMQNVNITGTEKGNIMK